MAIIEADCTDLKEIKLILSNIKAFVHIQHDNKIKNVYRNLKNDSPCCCGLSINNSTKIQMARLWHFNRSMSLKSKCFFIQLTQNEDY